MEARESKIKVPDDLVSTEDSLSGLEMVAFLLSSYGHS